MKDDLYNNNPKMSSKEFELFSNFIYTNFGIKMPPAKRLMLSGRITKRLKECGCETFIDYYSYVNTKEGKEKEINRMIDVITTNKTEFYREKKHFHILEKEILPEILQNHHRSSTLNFWSAGCSTGEEPYTLSMVLEEFFSKHYRRDYKIYGTDISQRVLHAAMSAVYHENEIHEIPLSLRKKYFLRGIGENAGLYKIVPELRKRIIFKQLNFNQKSYGFRGKMHVIFFRNVMIYFNKETQRDVLEKLCDCLTDDGYLILGSSESIFGLTEKLVSVGPTVYRKRIA